MATRWCAAVSVVLIMCIVDTKGSGIKIYKYNVTGRTSPLPVVDVFRCGLKQKHSENVSFRIFEHNNGCFVLDGRSSTDEITRRTIQFFNKNVKVVYNPTVELFQLTNTEFKRNVSMPIPFVLREGHRVIVTVGNLSRIVRIDFRGNSTDKWLAVVVNKQYGRIHISERIEDTILNLKDKEFIPRERDRHSISMDVHREKYVASIDDSDEVELHSTWQISTAPTLICQMPYRSSEKFNLHSVEFQQVITPAECADLKLTSSENGTYSFYPGGKVLLRTVSYCEFSSSGLGWTVIQRRFNGSTDFFRSWVDYKSGFGSPNGEYWLGNDLIHELTSSSNHELLIVMSDFEGETRHAQYSTFRVDGENDMYKLFVDGYSGTAGDSLISAQNGQKFSTFDNDNDIDDLHCAETYKGGWWYGSCHQANLNGLYLGGHHKSYADGINWYTWRHYFYSLKETTMMTRKTLINSVGD